MKRSARFFVSVMISMGLLLVALPSGAIDESSRGIEAQQAMPPWASAYDQLDVEDHSGYSSEYIFGMTKGIMRSTLTPALKPVILLVTVPLDIAFLPFAAIGGFFR